MTPSHYQFQNATQERKLTRNLGELVYADEITFRFETRQMSDEDFERISTIKEEGTLDEATLLAKSEHRKRK